MPRHRMKLTNETPYPQRELRKIFLWCVKHEGAENQAARRVEVRLAPKSSAIHGRASLGGGWIEMSLPKPEKGEGLPSFSLRHHITERGLDGYNLARIFIHEIGHNLDLEHREMWKWWNIELPDFPKEFLRIQPRQPKQTEATEYDKDRAELEKAEQKVKEWERKKKLATTKLTKWRQKVSYRQRKLADREAANDQE